MVLTSSDTFIRLVDYSLGATSFLTLESSKLRSSKLKSFIFLAYNFFGLDVLLELFVNK